MSDKENQIRCDMHHVKMLINSSFGISSQEYHNLIDIHIQLKMDLKKEIKREIREKKLNRILYEC